MGRAEFDVMVDVLRNVGVEVLVDDGIREKISPDAHFPNNWISFHQGSKVAVYPMFAESRRRERRDQTLDVVESAGFRMEEVVDYTEAEKEGVFLEGTGSMVLDRKYRKAYAARSERTHEDLFLEFCEDFEYDPVIFSAYVGSKGDKKAIYHTNVMMSIGESFVIICLEAITKTRERKTVLNHLRETGREIIAISLEQLEAFAGNVLEVRGKDANYLVISETAHRMMEPGQVDRIQQYAKLLPVSVPTVELCGGGSVRCMLAEVFLPRNEN
jgi:hypothetical protein